MTDGPYTVAADVDGQFWIVKIDTAIAPHGSYDTIAEAAREANRLNEEARRYVTRN